jgi:hypothetical protein
LGKNPSLFGRGKKDPQKRGKKRQKTLIFGVHEKTPFFAETVLAGPPKNTEKTPIFWFLL